MYAYAYTIIKYLFSHDISSYYLWQSYGWSIIFLSLGHNPWIPKSASAESSNRCSFLEKDRGNFFF